MRTSIGIAVLAAACAGGTPAEGPANARQEVEGVALQGSLAVRSLLETHNSGLGDSVRQVISDSETLARVWAQAHEGMGEVPAVPNIDFSREMVVVAALGTRNSGGYTITIDSAVVRGQTLHVYVRKTSPGPTCGTTAALTEPATIVAIPRSSASVVFEEISRQSDCG